MRGKGSKALGLDAWRELWDLKSERRRQTAFSIKEYLAPNRFSINVYWLNRWINKWMNEWTRSCHVYGGNWKWQRQGGSFLKALQCINHTFLGCFLKQLSKNYNPCINCWWWMCFFEGHPMRWGSTAVAGFYMSYTWKDNHVIGSMKGWGHRDEWHSLTLRRLQASKQIATCIPLYQGL